MAGRLSEASKSSIATVLIVTMLLSFPLSLILIASQGEPVAADPDLTTYDFKGDENHRAWEEAISSAGSLTNVPFVPSLSEAESGDYNNIENTDDVRWETTLALGLEAEWNVQYFKFDVAEDADTIDNIELLWEGFGKEQTGKYAMLYVWDNSGGSWSWTLYNVGTSHTSDENLENTITSNLANYIYENSGEGQFWLAVKAQSTAGPDQKIATDYVRVKVNYTPPPPPPVFPTQPTLYLPSDGTVTNDNTPYFEWENGENADNHRLLVDNDSDFSSPEENQVILNDNRYTIGGENSLPDDNYSWKVIAVNENGENESAVWTFVIDNISPTLSIVYAGKDGEDWVNYVRMPDNYMEIKVSASDANQIENVILEWYDNGAWENYEMDNIGGNNFLENMTGLENERDYSFNVWAIDKAQNETKVEWLRRDNEGNDNVRRIIRANYAPVDNLDYRIFYFVKAPYNTYDTPPWDFWGAMEHEQQISRTENDFIYLSASLPAEHLSRYCDAWVGAMLNENMTIPYGTVIDNVYIHAWWNTLDTGGSYDNHLWYYKDFVNGVPTQAGVDGVTIGYETSKAHIENVRGFFYTDFYLESRFWDLDRDNEYNSNDIYSFQINIDTDQFPEWVSSMQIMSFLIINIPDNATLQGMDSDGDNWSDYKELYETYTNPFQPDTDFDFLPDNEDPEPLFSDVPALYSPENGATVSSKPTLIWRRDIYADYHRLLVDNDDDFSSPIENTKYYTENSYAFTTAIDADNYYWKVVPSVGDETDVWVFEVIPTWQNVENWTGAIDAYATWELIETWTGAVEAPVAWQLVETWTGTIETPVAWELIETWTGTISATSAWGLIETWTGAVDAYAAWRSIETWTDTVEAFAEWNLIETWSGDMNAPAEWNLIETWSGDIQHLLAEVTTESATDVGMTIATLNALVTYGSYPSVDIRFQYRVLGAGTWDVTAWENDYTATLYSKAITGLSSSTTYQFRGHIEFGAFENYGSIVEFTTQTEAPPTEQWYSMENWAGTIRTEDVVRWRSAETWEGTIMTASPSEEPPPSGPGPEPEPEPEPDQVPIIIPLGIASAWSILIIVCFTWLWSLRHGPMKRRWAHDFNLILSVAAILTLALAYTYKVTLGPLVNAFAAWAFVFVLALINLASVEAGPPRMRRAKQFLLVVVTLIILTIAYLRINGVM